MRSKHRCRNSGCRNNGCRNSGCRNSGCRNSGCIPKNSRALEVMKIFLLFYMCHFAMALHIVIKQQFFYIYNNNKSIQRAQTPPRPKSDPGFECGFPDWSGSGSRCLRIALKMYWIHSIVGTSHFVEYRKNRPATVWQNGNKSSKIPYSTMVREMEKWFRIRIRDSFINKFKNKSKYILK